VSVEPRFDELIHPSTRLSLVALLASADWIDFAFLRHHLGLSDSALSKQLSTLEEAGYIATERPVTNRRRRVRARLTDDGRRAFDGHVAALRTIVATAEPGLHDRPDRTVATAKRGPS
jgi:DNA-binding MarR family transcriptional regulator